MMKFSRDNDWCGRLFKAAPLALMMSFALPVLPVHAAKKITVELSIAEAKKIAPNYAVLTAKAKNEGAIAIMARVSRTGITEDSAGSYQQGLKDLKKFAKTLGVKTKREIARQGVVSFEATPAQLDALIASGFIASIEEDVKVEALLDVSVPWIGGDLLHAAGNVGAGKAVAILDTGVDGSHPFVAGRIVEEACFSIDGGGAHTLCPNGQTTMFGFGAADDACNTYNVGDCQHGTHVAGIAAGANASMTGVAPGADIVAVQIFFYSDSDSRMYTSGSDQLAALDWVLNDATSDIAAVNLSIGGGLWNVACDSDFIAGAVSQLRAAGIATVIAAGNNGSQTEVTSPGCIADAITVASSLKDQDVFSSFSNVSPLVDVVAPGSNIYSSTPSGGYAGFYGTSMATPHVAGAVTALMAQFPWANVDDIENALKSTGAPVVQSSSGLTFPRINVYAASNALAGINSAIYQAETQTWSHAAVETEHLGFTGTGYVNTANAAGEWLEFSINAPSAGIYPIVVNYANLGAARPADVVVNGEFKTIDPQFTATGAWNSWGAESFNVTLEAGINTLRFVAQNSTGLANIDRLTMTLPPQNRAPVVLNAIDDIVMALNDPEYLIDLDTVFTDPDGDTLYFDKDSSNSDSLNVRFINGTHLLQIDPVETGSEWFEIRAFDDDGAEATITFTMTVTANHDPVIINPLQNITITQGSASFTIDLDTVFNDADGDVLRYFDDTGYEGPNLSIPWHSSIMTISAVNISTTYHEILAVDGLGGSVISAFTLTVVPNSNNAPVIANQIANITMQEGEAAYLIDLNTVFTDPDGDTLVFDKEASNSESPNVRFSDASHLRINPLEAGTETYFIRATDPSGASVWFYFDMTVIGEANLAPIVVNPIANIQMTLGDAPISIDLNGVFSDPEGGALTFTHYEQDEELGDATLLAGGILQIDADYAGTNVHTIYAFDNQGAEAVVVFNVSITTGSFNVELQAEDQTWLNGTVDTNHAGFTGSGFVNTENVLGTWFDFNVDAPAAGDYLITVRFANGSTNRPQQIYVNGNPSSAVNFDNTGAWTTWVNQTFIVHFDNPGSNHIRMTSLTAGGAASLDKITVTRQ